MGLELNESDISEILRYLGYRGTGLTHADEVRIAETIELTNSVIKPACAWKLFETEYMQDGILLINTGFKLQGESIKKHLNGASKAVLLCVTLGHGFDVEVERSMVRDPAFSVVLNACGIQAVEKYADMLQRDIDAVLAPLHTGVRFSPGYGDLPLESQADFLRILDASRRAGIRLNENYLMDPIKSVTAVAGVIE